MKSEVIEAVQFSPIAPLPDGVVYDGEGYAVLKMCPRIRVRDGDWIITYPNGWVQQFNPSLFEATYEPVDLPI